MTDHVHFLSSRQQNTAAMLRNVSPFVLMTVFNAYFERKGLGNQPFEDTRSSRDVQENQEFVQQPEGGENGLFVNQVQTPTVQATALETEEIVEVRRARRGYHAGRNGLGDRGNGERQARGGRRLVKPRLGHN